MPIPTTNHPMPVTRDDLYDLVWSSPMAEVAAKFGVSGSYLTRVCKDLNVPRPLPGHWAKLAAGKPSPPRCPLPPARPGDSQVWQRGAWPPKEVRVDPVPPDPRVRRRRLPKGALPGRHPLLAGAKEALEESRTSYRAHYQKPRTGKLLDIVVSKSGVDAVLQLANQIYLALEARGHRVVLTQRDWGLSRPEFDERETVGRRQSVPDLWAPSRLTMAYLGSVPIGLTLVELSEQAEVQFVDGRYVRLTDLTPAQRRVNWPGGWRQTEEMPSGRFMLVAYCPEQAGGWKEEWRESHEGELLKKIPAIVRSLELAAPKVALAMTAGREREALRKVAEDAAHAQWVAEEDRRRQALARRASREDLLGIISVWSECRTVEAFLSEVEKDVRGADLGEGERRQLLDRLQGACALVSCSSALQLLAAWRLPQDRLVDRDNVLASLARRTAVDRNDRL